MDGPDIQLGAAISGQCPDGPDSHQPGEGQEEESPGQEAAQGARTVKAKSPRTTCPSAAMVRHDTV